MADALSIVALSHFGRPHDRLARDRLRPDGLDAKLRLPDFRASTVTEIDFRADRKQPDEVAYPRSLREKSALDVRCC
jgi:hypothetical protein